MLKRILAALAVLGVLAGCNTMEVAGKDIERGGERVQDNANKNR